VPLFPSDRSRSDRPVGGRPVRAGFAVAVAAMALIALAGCAPDDGAPGAKGTSSPRPSSSLKPTDAPTGTAAPSGSPTPTSTPTPTRTPAPTHTPTPAPTPAGTALSIGCDQVLTPDDVYAFNPNVGTAPGYQPAGRAARTAMSHQGVACGWLNQTSDELIEVSIVQPNGPLKTQLTDAAIADSKPVSTYGTPPAVNGFFTTTGGAGEAQVFTDKYWVTVNSVSFFEPGDAQQLVAAVISHLP
jgi:hypothetical protein